jgi:Fur family transcriptional regulator, peroxide stress response regulator
LKPSTSYIQERLATFTASCRAAGMNLTPQRLAIYRTLLEASDHPTPEALYERVRPAMPSLSLGTIYKTLDALRDLGLVAELPATGSSRRYDANMQRHHHLVCERCGSVSDYSDPNLDRIAPPTRLKGFTVHSMNVHIHGLCGTCARGRGTH